MPRLLTWLKPRLDAFFFGSQASGLATDDEKAETRRRVETRYPGLQSADSAVVDLLYVEAKGKYDAGRDRLKALDAKAGTLITIITTGFGAFAILGDPTKLGSNAWVVIALLCLAIAFVFALVAQLPRDVHFPELSLYVSLDTAKNSANAVRIKYELARSWVRDADVNDRSGFAKKRLLNLSTTLLGIGLASLTLNYTVPPAAQKPIPTFRVILQATPVPTITVNASPTSTLKPTPAPRH